MRIANDAPTKTGTGASGTWGINITGNAATATNGVTTSNIGSYAPGLTGSGASSTSGTSGTSGSTGTSGISQTAGTSGTSGTSGSTGTSGLSGAAGSAGTSGTSGTSGTAGSLGTSGAAGTAGTSGTSGTSGTNGSSGTISANEIVWSTTSANIVIEANPTPNPDVPSIIATVARIDQFLSNTGSFSGSFTGEFTGSLFGTASFATSASQAQTANTASYALNAVTASFVTASNVFGPFGSNSVISASYAVSASHVIGGVDPFPYTGSAKITGSLGVTGSVAATTVQSNVFINSQTITDTLYINSGSNALIIGPVGISSSITVGTGSNLYITDFTNPTPNLQEVTDVGSTTTNSITAANFITTSDRRLKSDIKQIENPFEVLGNIKSYEYVKDGKKDAGFIAQEVQETIPYSVFENEEGMLTMSDRPLLAYLYAAVMELKEENKQLKEELKNIKP